MRAMNASPMMSEDAPHSFAMPHDQLDQDFLGFFNTKSELHHRVNPRENVVGWYTTTKASDTDAVGEEDAHLHAFFEEKIGDRYPCVLLRVDANIQSATSIGVSAFVARSPLPAPRQGGAREAWGAAQGEAPPL